jgi:ABC-2 type transport system permease protein
MSTPTTIAILSRREFHDRIRNRAYIIGTLITLAIIVAAIVVPTLLRDDGPRQLHVGVVGVAPGGFAEALALLAATNELRIELVDLAHREKASEQVRDGRLDAALIDGRELMVDGPASPALRATVDAALQQVAMGAELDAAGMSRQEMAAVLGAHEPITVVDPDGAAEEDQFGWLVAMAITVLLFLSIQASGTSLLNGAIEEKSSRVVEVLLGTVRPWHLLSGKIIALTVLTFVQMALLVAAGLGANAVVGAYDLPATTASVVVWSLAFTAIGFVFYAALFTVAGTLSSSVEEAQAAAGPLMFAVMGAYLLVFITVIPSPTSMMSHVLTYVPATAPFTVPARIALDAISGWEIALAVVATVAGAALTVRIAGRLYGASVLAGGKLTWRAAWQAEPVR